MESYELHLVFVAHKHVWQSHVEIKHYSVAYFDRISYRV